MVHYLSSSMHFSIVAADITIWKDMELPLPSIMAVDTLPVPVSTLKLLDIVGHCPVLDVVLLDTPMNICCGELLLSPLNAVPLYTLPFLIVVINTMFLHKMHMHFLTGWPRSCLTPTFCNLNLCVYIIAFGNLWNSKLMSGNIVCACRSSLKIVKGLNLKLYCLSFTN